MLKSTKRFWLAAMLALSTAGLALPAEAAFFTRRAWCEGALAREPREITAFREEFEAEPSVKDYLHNQRKNGLSVKVVLDAATTLLSQAQFTEISTSLRAKILAYTLIQYARIPSDDLKRLLLAYQWFLQQRTSTFGGSIKGWASERSITVPIDLSANLAKGGFVFELYSDHLAALHGDLILHVPNLIGKALDLGPVFLLVAVPLPLFTLLPAVRDFWTSHFLRRLDSPTQTLVLKTQKLFADKITPYLSSRELEDNWDQSVQSILNKSGSLKKTGLLMQIGRSACDLAATKFDPREGIVSLLGYTDAKTLRQINPLNWKELLQFLKLVKGTAVKLNPTDDEVEAFRKNYRKLAQLLNGNQEARLAILSLADSSFQQQSLPE